MTADGYCFWENEGRVCVKCKERYCAAHDDNGGRSERCQECNECAECIVQDEVSEMLVKQSIKERPSEGFGVVNNP